MIVINSFDGESRRLSPSVARRAKRAMARDGESAESQAAGELWAAESADGSQITPSSVSDRAAVDGAAAAEAADATVTAAAPAGPDLSPTLIATNLRPAIMRAARRLRTQNVGGLSGSQYSILAVLDRDGASSPSQLAADENVQPPSMTRMISSLEALGLVERTIDQGDRRRVSVSLTKKGRQTVRQTRQRRDEWLSQRLMGLSASELRTMAEAAQILEEMAQND